MILFRLWLLLPEKHVELKTVTPVLHSSNWWELSDDGEGPWVLVSLPLLLVGDVYP